MRLRSMAVWCAIAAAVVWTLLPFVWAVLTTFKIGTSVYNNEWIPWLQFEPSLRNWQGLFRLPVLREAILTSAAVSIAVATLSILLAGPAAYSIARMHWSRKWQKGLLIGFIGQRLLPPVVLVTPYLLLSAYFHFKDTIQGLVLVNVTFMFPLALIVVHGAFARLPPELVEAAQLDGASSFRVFVQIATPLAAPAIVAAWTLCLAFTWNEWLYADMMSFTEVETMSVALITVAGGGAGGGNVGSAMTRVLAMMVVPIVAALATQRFIASGLSMGAVKA